MILIDFIVCILILIAGFKIKNRYKNLNSYDRNLLNKIYFFHILMSLVFYTYIIVYGGDAETYWESPKFLPLDQIWEAIMTGQSKSYTMFLINFIPSNILGLSFFTGTLIYGVIGYWSFVYLILIIKKNFPAYHLLQYVKILGFIPFFPLILFLPNMHFWSGGVGKDTLLFFVVLQFFYSVMDFKKRYIGVLISIGISYLLRPHITLFLVTALSLGFLLDSKMKIYRKFFLLLIMSLAFFPLLNIVLEFAQIDDLSLASFEKFSSMKSGHLKKAGSGVDISSYPYYLKVLTFLYRPIFFDAHNALAFLSSFENLIYIILSLKFVRTSFMNLFRYGNFIIKGAFFFYVVGALAFAPVLSNFGIIIREKNMFIPTFLLLIIAGFYYTYITPVLRKRSKIQNKILEYAG